MKKLDVNKLLKSRFSDDDGGDYVEPPSTPPKQLYHVTHRKNLDSIRKKGLTPKIGDVTKSAHGDRENPATPLVYLLDGIAPGIFEGKDSVIITVDPSENDIWYFSGYELIRHGGSYWGEEISEGDFPIGIEPGDYYSESKVVPSGFFDYRGNEITAAKYPEAKKGDSSLTFIYESGGRDIEHPFSGDSLDELAEETEGESGGWQIDLRNASRREKGGYPSDDEDSDWGYQKDVRCYPSYYSKKGAPRGEGYPIEKDWWQKALSFTRTVKGKYHVVIRNK